MFHRPICLYRSPDGFGNINYSNPSGAQPPFVNIGGARNGTSLDTASFVTLGQLPAAVGSPGILLQSREIPAGGFQLNFSNGQFIISDATKTGSTGRLEVYDSLTAAVARNTVLINPTWNTTGAPTAMLVNATNTASNIGSLLFAAQASTRNIFNVQVSGLVNYLDPAAGLHGLTYAGFSPSVYNGGTLRSAANAALGINATWHPAATPGGNPATIQDISIGSTVILDTSSEVDYTAINIAGGLQMSGGNIGSMRGIFYHPTINGSLDTPNIAFENQSGNVLFNNQTPGTTNLGTVGIRLNIFPGDSPAAYLHIAAGQAGAGLAPLKIDAGVLLTVPENGAIENDGTHFYVTLAGTRHQIVVL